MNSLGERMKRYELTSKSYLLRRAPVIVRIDGKSFHTLTKNFKRPFDKVFMTAMDLTMQDLCKKVQGCVFGYTQSDEITLFLCDYKELNTDAYFDYNVQKITSVIASMATCSFIIHLTHLAAIEFMPNLFGENKLASITEEQFKNYTEKAIANVAFDARCFNIPKDDVCNNFIWRQNDCYRNAILSISYATFPSKSYVYKKSVKNLITELYNFGVDVDKDFSRRELYGCACYKDANKRWHLDYNIPTFKHNRAYIEKHEYY